MDLFGSNRENDCIGWTTSNPSCSPQYDDWLLGPSQSSTSATTSNNGPEDDFRKILTMDHTPDWRLLQSPAPLVRGPDANGPDPQPARPQAPRRLLSDASWDAVRHRRVVQRQTLSSPSNAQAGPSSAPWRPWDDRPPTSQNVPSTSGPSNSTNPTPATAFYIPPGHKLPSPNASEILKLLNSMNDPSRALTSNGNGKEGAQAEEDDPTALSSFTCPVCFSPPENATLTPCGHVMCGKCLFSAIKAARQRHAGLYGREGLAPDGTRNEAICPVCRVPIPGWDGRGGGVIGLSIMVEEV